MTHKSKLPSSPSSAHKLPSALLHGLFSAKVLPGEDQAEFKKLHRKVTADLAPSGALEDDIVKTIVHLIWRKQNLQTLHNAKLARNRLSSIVDEMIAAKFPDQTKIITHPDSERIIAAAKDQVRAELGDAYALVEIGEACKRSVKSLSSQVLIK